MPDLNGRLTDGDRVASEQAKAHAPVAKSSWIALSLIAVASGVAYAVWAIPALLAATVVFAGWALMAFVYTQVEISIGVSLTNASRLQIIEGKVDRLLETESQARKDRYRDEAAF